VAVARVAEVVDRRDVGVRDAARLLRLAPEACEGVGVLTERRAHELQRGGALEPDVLGAVDLAHAAAADERDDAIAVGDQSADDAVGRGSHGGREIDERRDRTRESRSGTTTVNDTRRRKCSTWSSRASEAALSSLRLRVESRCARS
jgi:hypothetical protein